LWKYNNFFVEVRQNFCGITLFSLGTLKERLAVETQGGRKGNGVRKNEEVTVTVKAQKR
jgi:hypothetical protein